MSPYYHNNMKTKPSHRKGAGVKLLLLLTIAVFAAVLLLSCTAKRDVVQHREAVKRPNWSQPQAREAIEKLAQQYRAEGEEFWSNRKYVWSGTWVWEETIGINYRHLNLLKQMFYNGDDAVKEIVLQVILMNIPPDKLEKAGKSFLADLVRVDTELKERRANVPPPTPYEEIIEEYLPE